ncbi:MAG: hypothetical protein MZW92_18845 [Comamonadaceae bacterium]|nr:hypothetical protein [Comamonadaceae bacterium]
MPAAPASLLDDLRRLDCRGVLAAAALRRRRRCCWQACCWPRFPESRAVPSAPHTRRARHGSPPQRDRAQPAP